MSKEVNIRLGTGAYGIGVWRRKGSIAVEIRPAVIPGSIGSYIEEGNYHYGRGAVIHLGTRAAADVLLRNILKAREGLPE